VVFDTTQTAPDTPAGTPLEFDLTAMEFDPGKGKVKKVRIRNVGVADITVNDFNLSWTNGVAAQKLKKFKENKPDRFDLFDGNGANGVSVPANLVIPSLLSAPLTCEYALEIAYTDGDDNPHTSTATFNDDPGNVDGDPLEINFDEAKVDAGRKKIDGILLEADSGAVVPLKITGARVVLLEGGPPLGGQSLKKAKDVTDGIVTTLVDGLFALPTSFATSALPVGGGFVAGDCPKETLPDEPPIPTYDPYEPPAVPDDSGLVGDPLLDPLVSDPQQSVSDTATAGGGRKGRLFWREIIQ
jgi:hypothetical protein